MTINKQMGESMLHSNLLFALSHYTEQIVEDLESHKRDSLEEVVYRSLKPTIDTITSFDTFSSIAKTLMNYLEHKSSVIQIRILQIIQRMIELGPRPKPTPTTKKEKDTD